MKNAIFLAFDDKHWHYFIRLFNSIQENYPNHPILLIHYSSLNNNRIKWLRNKKNVKLYITKNLPKDFNYSWYHRDVQSKMVYFKYMLWTNDYDEYDNILHLDVDTLVVSPLDEVFEKKKFFVVKNNIPFKEVRILPGDKQYKSLIDQKLKAHGLAYPKHDDMVNAGIFMIPKAYRTKEYLNSLLEITKDFGSLLVYADQSALSLWCLKNGISPSEEYQYNFQFPLFNKSLKPRYEGHIDVGGYFSLKNDILNKIKIIHYSGPIKPNYPEFMSWWLMGKYSKLFKEYYQRYSGVKK